MFKFFEGPKKQEQSQLPAFEELKSALPEELKDEFQELGEKISKIPGGAMDGREIEEETLSDEEKKIFARYNELTKIAQGNLEKKES